MVERVKTKFVPVNHDSAEVEFFSHTSFDSGLVEKSVHATNVTKRHKKRSWYGGVKDVAINYFCQSCIVPIFAFTFLNKFE